MVLIGSLVGEPQLRIPKLGPDIIVSNMLPLVSVELEYHADCCSLKSPSIMVGLGKEGNLLCKSLLWVCRLW